MSAENLARAIWYNSGPGWSLVRGLLSPVSLCYAAAVGVRNVAFNRGAFAVRRAPVPVVSVGNLSVGGTGKTPVAAHVASIIAARGFRPAIVLRNYGIDESAVHRRLNPAVPVIATSDRLAAVQKLANDGLADSVVLDDGFQHRRLHRDLDIVLVSADAPRLSRLLLPAGPWREPFGALRRAHLLVVTRKMASAQEAAALAHWLRVPERIGLRTVTMRLASGPLRTVAGRESPLSGLRGQRVFLLSSIADPVTLRRQIVDSGAAVTQAVFGDHHAFSSQEVELLLERAAQHDIAVCTLKDYVKLEQMWPHESVALWYLSQSVEIENGEEFLFSALDSALQNQPASP